MLLVFCCAAPAVAQTPPAAAVTGRVLDATTNAPVVGAFVAVEGTTLGVVTDTAGRFLLLRVPAGPQALRAERIGYATTRVSVVVPGTGMLTQEIRVGVSALQVPGIIVTADPAGRARGELGTASVIEREAIRHQTAASLAGLLELVPGVVLRPPGLDNVQQISLRSVPTATFGAENLGASAGDLASAGTLIVLDGVPLSNNANLQTLGPRGELPLGTSAGGGVDLRRIPATLIERVEVIRGVPSARYGDLTQGAVIVDTRAGAVDSEVSARRDRQTMEASVVAGRGISARHEGTALFNVARTLLAPGTRDDEAYRVAGQLAHRFGSGAENQRFTLDTRLDVFQVLQDTPEQPEVLPGRMARNRDSGIRLRQRARLRPERGPELELTTSIDRQQQSSYSQYLQLRPVMAFTRNLTEGRAIGYFTGGIHPIRVDVDGNPWLLYSRLESAQQGTWLGLEHELRAGVELRREWNSGPGYQFDLDFPPQISFNEVQGFDRPRRYDDVPPLATSALYVDDRISRQFADMHVMLQAGLRLDVLHAGTHWFSGSRDAVLQPRVNAQFAPRQWLRLRAGAGRTTKQPTLAQLYPAPQYHDIVNVNWYANDPAERLAVLTTFILDPTNPELRQAVTTKQEAGVEIGLGRSGGVFALVAFRDRVKDGVGLMREPRFLLRDQFQLADSTLGTGQPPQIIEPPTHADTIPVLLVRPANTLTLETSGYEVTLALPELARLHTRVEVQAAWLRTSLHSDGIEVGNYFGPFQVDPRRARTPYWEGSTQTGERTLLNYRVIHQQPTVGLVITATVQHTAHEVRHLIAATDTLDFAGYVTRAGELVPVPAADRSRAEFADIQLPRRGVLTDEVVVPPDWLLSLQVSKSLPLEGRLSFYAFNAFDRVGQYSRPGRASRLYPGMRFGVEVTLQPGALLR
jgi:outer membrane receptor protein involved in Fe transport